jgi:23S rRNA pseudouridine2605 synthase
MANEAGRDYAKAGKRATTAKDDSLIRLNRYISNSGICSRREADVIIESGAISVNGEVVTELGTKVSDADIIKYNGQLLRREKPVYVLLNKPKDFITTTDDPQERKTVMQLVESATEDRIYPVGRLDRNTTGLLLFTNDGEMAQRLMHPKYDVRKIYLAQLDKKLTRVHFDEILEGLELEDGLIKVDELSYVDNDHSQIGIEIHSGRNRIIHRIFEHLGYVVEKLDRVLYADLSKKDLPRGKWRLLTDLEIRNLKKITRMK